MKAALVLRGGPKVPDLTKAQNLGINRLYWEAEDPQLDASLLDAVRAKGFSVGIMRDPHWNGDTPEILAARLSKDLDRLGSTSKQCAVIADIEVHDSAYLLSWLHNWRIIRPTRETAWTMEPFQGGWFSPALVSAINADPNIAVVPQGYYGDMRRVNHDQLRCDILARGVNCVRYKAFYADVPGNGYWDGIAWDLAQIKTI